MHTCESGDLVSDVGSRPVRALARSLDPLPEESLPGFLLRLAYRLDRSPLRIAKLSGLDCHTDSIHHVYLRGLHSGAAGRFAHATRLDEREAHDLTLQRFSSLYSPLTKVPSGVRWSGNTSMVNWAMSNSSKYCPQCLRGDGSLIQAALGGAWRLRWHLPIVFACQQHNRLLENLCPACEQPPNGTVKGRPGLIKYASTKNTHPLQCRNRISADQETCGTRLDQPRQRTGFEARLHTEDLGRLVALQQRLNRRLTADHDAEMPTQSDLSFFPDLVSAAQLIKLSWPTGSNLLPSSGLADLVDQHAGPIVALAASQPASTIRGHLAARRMAPDDTAQCAALLLAADTLLEDREFLSLQERIRPLTQVAYKRAPTYSVTLFNGTGISTSLARAGARRFNRFQERNTIREFRLNKYQFSVHEIPPFLPRNSINKYFLALIAELQDELTLGFERHLRRAASLRLAHRASGNSLALCAKALDIPHGRAVATDNALQRAFRPNDLWPEFEAALDKVAQDIDDSPERTNYTRRRKLLTDWKLPDSDWREIIDTIPQRKNRGTQDPLLGTILIWSEVTRSHYEHCPALSSLPIGSVERRRVIAAICQLNKATFVGKRPRFIRVLERYAAALSSACDKGRDLKIPAATVIGK